jgi:hypothetical protein
MDGLKAWLLSTMGLKQDALHIYFGFVLFFGAALVFRKPLSSWRPWLLVVVVALGKEGYDIVTDLRAHGQWSAFKSGVDIFSVVIWPTVMMFLVRHGLVFNKQ